ncbi:hypothetical protein CQ054_04355 [Ochrobactrum sp. MYb29]|nr:hypothetical protein CQ054_04355 [Ochrobactrum sp. MYb29]
MKLKLAIIGLLALGGCQSALGPKPPTTPIALNDTQVQIVKDGLKKALKDPDSAVFGSMKASQSDKKGIMNVCGTVNAKNSFGGFSGQSPYVGVLASLEMDGKTIGSFTLTQLGHTKRDADSVMTMCRHFGVL